MASANGDLGATERARVVVLGGGFGGVYTALALERLAAKGAPVEVALVNRENYLVFQPMLAEVIAGDVGILDTVSPLRQLLPTHGPVRAGDRRRRPERRVVTLGAGLTPQTLELGFDHLVLALGNVTDFRGVPGLPEHALPFKTLADAVRIRNHVINVLEQASVLEDPELRRAMLTFVDRGRGLLRYGARGRATRLRARRSRRLPLDPARGDPDRARAQRHERARARAHRAPRRLRDEDAGRAGDRTAARRAPGRGQPAWRGALRRAADRHAHADLDRALLAEPGPRADLRPADRPRARASARRRRR